MRMLTVDAGTTTVKAAVVGDGGVIESVARVPVPRRSSLGLDAEDFWNAVADAISEIADEAGVVDAVAVTGQGDGLWTVGHDGNAGGTVYEWNSTVAAQVVTDWEASGLIEEHFRHSGTALWPGTNAAIWTWAREHDPALVESTAHVFFAKDWINYRLTGEIATDVTDGSIPFLDIDGEGYDADAFPRLGCDDLADKVAPILPIGARVGVVTNDAAKRTGLQPGTPVLLGCIDGLALLAGANVTEVGDAAVVLGTTAAAMAITDTLDLAAEPAGATLRMNGAEPRYVRFTGASSGTSTLDWFLDACYPGDRPHERFWADVAEGRPGVLLLPYLAGERAPFLAPEATGTFLGLTPQTRRPELARAVAVGITLSLRHCLEHAADGTVDSVVLSGGGAASPEWCQLTADVLGCEVRVDERPHVACAGVAAATTGTKVTEADDLTVFAPRHSHDADFAQFVELGQAMRPLWTAMERTRQTRPDTT